VDRLDGELATTRGSIDAILPELSKLVGGMGTLTGVLGSIPGVRRAVRAAAPR
jgi:hypothetical protein